MADIIKKYDWGFSVIRFHGFKYVPGSNFKKQIHTAGESLVKVGGLIPFHFHYNDSEAYQALSWGLHVLVLSIEEATHLSDAEILKRVRTAPQMKIGQISICEQNQAHILYNSSDVPAKLKFTQYFSD